MNKSFSFIFPVTQGRIHHPASKVWAYDQVTELIVSGIATDNGRPANPHEDRYEFDILSILYEGVNVYPLLKAFDALSKIEAACDAHIGEVFTGDGSEYTIPEAFHMNHGLAKVIALPLRKRIR